MSVQSIVFKKSEWSKAQAKRWINQNNYQLTFFGKPMDENETEYRFRQLEPITSNEKLHGEYYITHVKPLIFEGKHKTINFVIKSRGN